MTFVEDYRYLNRETRANIDNTEDQEINGTMEVRTKLTRTEKEEQVLRDFILLS